MLEGKVSTDKWFPVILLDDTDFKTAETGKAYGSVTVKYHTEGATSQSTFTVTTDDWKEAGAGEYWLRIGAGEFSAAGKYEVSVACSGCLTFRFAVEVRSFTIEDLFTGANTGTIKLKTLDIQNSAGSAFVAKSTGGNGKGMDIAGNGSGSAIYADAGATGHGMHCLGGLTSGNGIYAQWKTTDGEGIKAVGENGIFALGAGLTDGHGIKATGFNIGAGIKAQGGSNGNGINAYAGTGTASSSAVHGIDARGDFGGNGIKATGDEAGHGIESIAGVTGNGIKATGGATSGDGINASAPTAGKGMKLTGAGTDGHGLETIGAGSYGCGIEARASDGDGIYGLGGGSHGHGIHGKGSSSCSAPSCGLLAEGNDGATGCGIKGYSALGKDISAAEIGTPLDLDGSGTSLASNAKDIFDNLSGGGVVDANIVTIEGSDATDVLAATSQVGAAAALTAYDPPTATELVSEINDVQGDIADVQTDVTGIVSSIGTPVALDGGSATLAGMLTKMADDSDGSAFDAGTDSLEAIAARLGTTISVTDLLDGVSIGDILEKLMAMADGRFAKNVPSTGYITFYKRDNSTPLMVVNVTTAGRTRV